MRMCRGLWLGLCLWWLGRWLWSWSEVEWGVGRVAL